MNDRVEGLYSRPTARRYVAYRDSLSDSVEEHRAEHRHRSLCASSFALNKHNSDAVQGDGTRIGKYIDNDRDALIDGRRCIDSALNEA